MGCDRKKMTDEEAYERWLQATPEYWAKLTETLTAKVIASESKNTFAVSGEIHNKEETWQDEEA